MRDVGFSFVEIYCNPNSSQYQDIVNSSHSTFSFLNDTPLIVFNPNNQSSNPDPAIALGYVLSFGFFGILVAQAFIYHTRFPRDSKWLRYTVWIIMLLESLSCAFALYALWLGVSYKCLACAITLSTPFLSFCSQSVGPDIGAFGGPDLLPTRSFLAISIITGLISSTVHAFYCRRMRVMGGSLILPAIIMAISLLQCVMVIYGGSRASVIVGLTPLSSLGGDSDSHSFVDYVWLGGSFTCDMIITIWTTWLLFRHKSKTQFKQTKSMLAKLIKITIETGMVTAIATLVELILSVKLAKMEHLVIFYSLSKLYANCMLASLNARLVISSDNSTCCKVTTLLFNVENSAETTSSRCAGCQNQLNLSQTNVEAALHHVDTIKSTGGTSDTSLP